MSAIPEDFGPLSRTSPFTDLLGPIHEKRAANGLIIGMLAEKKHCNARGIVPVSYTHLTLPTICSV